MLSTFSIFRSYDNADAGKQKATFVTSLKKGCTTSFAGMPFSVVLGIVSEYFSRAPRMTSTFPDAAGEPTGNKISPPHAACNGKKLFFFQPTGPSSSYVTS